MKLWQKEATEDGVLLYVNIYDELLKTSTDKQQQIKILDDKLADLKAKFGGSHKANIDSHGLCLEGDMELNRKCWEEAIEKYNRALCVAEVQSPHIREIYEKRAKCFFGMEMILKSIADIQLARNEQDSVDQSYLKEFEVECEKAMPKMPQNELYEPRLSFDAHTNFPEMANAVEFRYNEEYGRHLIATTDIDVGQVLFIDKSIASTTCDFYNRCNVCLKEKTNLIPCYRCTASMFCTECAEHEIHIHEYECGLDSLIHDSYGDFAIAVRSLIVAMQMFASVDELMYFVETVVMNKTSQILPSAVNDFKSKYRLFLKLVNTSVEFTLNDDYSWHFHVIYRFLMENPKITAYFITEQHRRFFMHLMFHHVILAGRIEKTHLSNIFTYYAYINHSCMANILLIEANNLNIGVALRPIQRNQQIFKSYFLEDDIVGDYATRQNYLSQNYGFECKCEWCRVKDIPFIEIRQKAIEGLEDDPDFKCVIEMKNDVVYSNDQNKRRLMNDKLISLLKKHHHILWTGKMLEIDSNYFLLLLHRFIFKLPY